MNVSIIVAVADNGVIGKDNQLIWHLPADMRYFKEKTTGHCVITGRKNYESIPEKFRPLPNRTNIVITRQSNYEAKGAIIANSPENALEIAKQKEDQDEIFIIGGAEIYRYFIPFCNRIYLTKIHHNFDGDAHFNLPENEWKLIQEEHHLKDEKNPYDYTFCLYEKS